MLQYMFDHMNIVYPAVESMCIACTHLMLCCPPLHHNQISYASVDEGTAGWAALGTGLYGYG